MSAQAVSTARPPARYGPLTRQALGRALVYSATIVAVIFALAFGPVLVRDPGAFLRALGQAGRLHAPNFGPILRASPAIQLHLLAVVTTLAVTGRLLTGVKGSTSHRVLGWTWTIAMLTTAVSAFFIHASVGPRIFGFGFLHVFALITVILVPRAVMAARRHDVASHARIICGFVVGGLGIAGLSAFLPGRIVWRVFFG